MCDDAQQYLFVIANIQVALDVSFQLRLAASQREKHRKGEKLSRFYFDAGSGQLIAETIIG